LRYFNYLQEICTGFSFFQWPQFEFENWNPFSSTLFWILLRHRSIWRSIAIKLFECKHTSHRNILKLTDKMVPCRCHFYNKCKFCTIAKADTPDMHIRLIVMLDQCLFMYNCACFCCLFSACSIIKQITYSLINTMSDLSSNPFVALFGSLDKAVSYKTAVSSTDGSLAASTG